MQLIRSGQNYYIWWGLDTGAEDQYPQVTIYEFDSATPIQTINFTHLVLGGYISSTALTYSGADLDVFGVAVVYSDAGHSVENTDYGREFPTFHIDDSSLDYTGLKHYWDQDNDKFYIYESDGITVLREFDVTTDSQGILTTLVPV